MKQIDITNKNKDLDLRRFGKNSYTKASQSGGNGSDDGGGSGGNDDSENDEELNAFMEFFDGLDDSFKKLPYCSTMDEYNDVPLPEQYELFGNKDTASNALVFVDNTDETHTYAVAFVSDDLYNKLTSWCFNYYGNNRGGNGKFSPIPLYSQGWPFLVADKLPLLVEKCMDSNEITDIPENKEANFIYTLKNSSSCPDFFSGYSYTLFPVSTSYGGSDEYIIFTFEENGKTYYAPGVIASGSGPVG